MDTVSTPNACLVDPSPTSDATTSTATAGPGHAPHVAASTSDDKCERSSEVATVISLPLNSAVDDIRMAADGIGACFVDLLQFMHGFPSCSADLAAHAAKDFLDSQAAAAPASTPAASSAALSRQGKVTKKAIDRVIKSACTNSTSVGDATTGTAKGKGKAEKVWAVKPAAWAHAGLEVRPLVKRDVPKPLPKAPNVAKAEVGRVSPGQVTSSSTPGQGAPASTADPGASTSAQPLFDTPASPPADSVTLSTCAVTIVGSIPATTAPVQSMARAPEPPHAVIPVPAPEPDPRAASHLTALKDSVRTTLLTFCGFSTEASSSSQVEGRGDSIVAARIGSAAQLGLVRSRILGPYSSEPHVEVLHAAFRSDTFHSSSSEGIAMDFPDRHVPLLAILAEGSSAPLACLASAITAFMNQGAQVAVTVQCVSTRLVLIAERKAYGVKHKGGQITEDEDNCECLLRWEVKLPQHLAPPTGANDAAAGDDARDADAADGDNVQDGKGGKSRRQLSALIKREHSMLKLLGEYARACHRMIEILCPPPGGARSKQTWAVDETKIGEATEKLQKAARALEMQRDIDRIEQDKRATRERERVEKEVRHKEEKERREQGRAADRDAKERERQAEVEAKEKERLKAIAPSARFMSAFLGKPSQTPATAAVIKPVAAQSAIAYESALLPVSAAPISIFTASASAAPASPDQYAPVAIAQISVPVHDTSTFDAQMGFGAFAGKIQASDAHSEFANWCKLQGEKTLHKRAAMQISTGYPRQVHSGAAMVDLTVDDDFDVYEVPTCSTGQSAPKTRKKMFKFHSDHRPAFFGTWSAVRAAKRLAVMRGSVAEASAAEQLESWDPTAEAGGASDENMAVDLPSATASRFYIDLTVTGSGKLSGRNPFGAMPSLFDYEEDSEAEWEEQAEDCDDVTDLERESVPEDDLEDESEGEGDGDVDGVKRKDKDALDYQDGWLCPDDVKEYDTAALARDKLARSYGQLARTGEDGLVADLPVQGVEVDGRVPGDESDGDCMSDAGNEFILNPAAMPGASSAVLGQLAEQAAPKRRRIAMPGAAGIAQIRDFTFGVSFDLEGYVQAADNMLARAAADLLAGRIESLGDATLTVLTPPKMALLAEGEVDDDAADMDSQEKDVPSGITANGGASADSGKRKAKQPKKEKKEKAAFPDELLPILVRMVHGSGAAVGLIVNAFLTNVDVIAYFSAAATVTGELHAEAVEGVAEASSVGVDNGGRATLPKLLVQNKIKEIACKGKWGYAKPAALVVAEASASHDAPATSSEMQSTPPAGSPGVAQVSAVAAVERDVTFVNVDLGTWVRAVMQAEGKDALPKCYTVLRYVVGQPLLDAIGYSLPADVELAASGVISHVSKKHAALGLSADKILPIPSWSQVDPLRRVAQPESKKASVATIAGASVPVSAPTQAGGSPTAGPISVSEGLSAGKKRRQDAEPVAAEGDTAGPKGADTSKKPRLSGSVNIMAMLSSKAAPLAGDASPGAVASHMGKVEIHR